MKRILTLLLGLFVATWVHAVIVYYQPTPYPAWKYGSTPQNPLPMPQDLNIVHIQDGWMNNYYPSIKTFQNTDQLKIGGWGDRYLSVLKFDATGLPSSATNAYLYLYSLPRGTSLSSQVALYRATSFWDPTTVHWGNLNLTGVSEPYYTTSPSTLPTLASGYSYSPSPGINAWYPMWITDWYNGWKNGTYVNHGIVIYPNDGNNNQFDYFVSSNSTSDGLRPLIRLDFTPTLELKMPLPGAHSWLVTTETGGYDCKGSFDQYHSGSNYFSIDFSWRNNPDSGATNYYESSNIPVIAAAGGTATVFYNDPDNGNYVVVTHGTTGFTTRYLHLDTISVSNNATVTQGATLGNMGNTGISSGKHLHFGVRYNNDGSSSISELTKVVMDGWILKSFQTECSVNGSGVPTDWIRYYRSGNTVY